MSLVDIHWPLVIKSVMSNLGYLLTFVIENCIYLSNLEQVMNFSVYNVKNIKENAFVGSAMYA